MLGGVFPLITDAMFTRMTFAGASSFLGGVVRVIVEHTKSIIIDWNLGSSLNNCTMGSRLLRTPDSCEKQICKCTFIRSLADTVS